MGFLVDNALPLLLLVAAVAIAVGYRNYRTSLDRRFWGVAALLLLTLSLVGTLRVLLRVDDSSTTVPDAPAPLPLDLPPPGPLAADLPFEDPTSTWEVTLYGLQTFREYDPSLADIELLLVQTLRICGYREVALLTEGSNASLVIPIERFSRDGRPVYGPDRWPAFLDSRAADVPDKQALWDTLLREHPPETRALEVRFRVHPHPAVQRPSFAGGLRFYANEPKSLFLFDGPPSSQGVDPNSNEIYKSPSLTLNTRVFEFENHNVRSSSRLPGIAHLYWCICETSTPLLEAFSNRPCQGFFGAAEHDYGRP